MATKSIQASSGVLATVVGMGTVALEYYVETDLFVCPCNHGIYKKIYFWVFLVIPFFVLYLIGLSINPLFWKIITGCNNELSGLSKLKWSCKYKARPFVFALVGPIVWLVVFIGDGKYIACIAIENPYEFQNNQSCNTDVKNLAFSKKYQDNKLFSQISGILFGLFISLFAWVWYTCEACNSKMNYYQQKYNSQCKEQIELLLVEEFVQKTVGKEDDTKGPKLAEAVKVYHKDTSASKFWPHVFTDIGLGKKDFTKNTIHWITEEQRQLLTEELITSVV